MSFDPEFARTLRQEMLKPSAPWPVCPKDHEPIRVSFSEGNVRWACSNPRCEHASPGYWLR